MTAEKIRAAVTQCAEYSGEPEILEEPDFARAVKLAQSVAEKGDIVLLSPASTSFDHFKNFEERGKYFKEIVNGLT
jgi:UDP-N-acetylmuramoylalanine--D-glutamate ligase